MPKLSRDQREAIQRRMEELTAQIHNLDTRPEELPVEERARLSHELSHEWLANYRCLRGDSDE
jgi:hypothetical protein